MAYKRKSWQEKLNINREPVIEEADKNFADIKAGPRYCQKNQIKLHVFLINLY